MLSNLHISIFVEALDLLVLMIRDLIDNALSTPLPTMRSPSTAGASDRQSWEGPSQGREPLVPRP